MLDVPVNEYLDHNELGLALDALVVACEQAEDPEPVAVYPSLSGSIAEASRRLHRV